MRVEEVKHLSETFLFQNYSREDVCFERGKGEMLYDPEGNEYLDLVAGIAVNVLGHSHPAVVKAACEQAGRLVHVSNLYQIREQALLAEALASTMPPSLCRSMFVNSGAEANEAALKLAVKKTGRGRFVSARNSFHGRTSASLSATGQPKYQAGFEPLLSRSFDFVDFGDAEQLKAAVTSETAGIILEPIQGEGGIVVPPADYLRTARDVCDEKDALLILDEVQTGLARTGRMYAFEHSGIVPDIVTLAKALGGGFPIGAMVSSDEVSKAFSSGTHGSTFGGNPFVCTIARTVVETIVTDGLDKRARDLGERWISELRSLSPEKGVTEVRGKGLMIGIEMPEAAKEFQRYAFERRILVNVCAGKVVRLVPPLILSENAVTRFNDLFAAFLSSRS